MTEKLNPDALAEVAEEENAPPEEVRKGVQPITAEMIYEYVVFRGDDSADNKGFNPLPPESAKPFSEWLHHVWYSFSEVPSDENTNGFIIRGAVAHWCGGSQ